MFHYVIENAIYVLNSSLLTASNIVRHMFKKQIIKQQKLDSYNVMISFFSEVNRQVPFKDMQCLTN